jgi:hypothetical protein
MEDIYLYDNKIHTINTLNGVLNNTNLEFAKRTMLFDVIRNHTELVKTRQGYPKDDLSDVEMTIDCVVMSRKRYDKLMKFSKLADKLEKEGKEYLKFPKLEP